MLIPALVAAPPSVEKLLRKPRYGEVRIELNNGDFVSGVVTRVTTEFIGVRDILDCELVPISDIRRVRSKPATQRLQDAVDITAMYALMSPAFVFLLAYEVTDAVKRRRRPLDGRWQSGDGTVLSIYGVAADRQQYAVEEGQFTVRNQIITMSSREKFDMTFGCADLTLTGTDRAYKLSTRPTTHPAAAPLVGDWSETRNKWTFRSDGTYQILRHLETIRGTIEKPGHDILIAWADGTQSTATRKHKTLSLTTNGLTEQYRESPPSTF
jgi:hypothetical protein